MKAHPLFSLRAKLLTGFAGVGALVAALLLLANYSLEDAAGLMRSTLQEQVRPLARLGGLQAQVNRIRTLELELPRLTDVFAATEHVELMNGESREFGASLRVFVDELGRRKHAETRSLEENWARYQADLARVTREAAAMNLGAVQQISTYESAERFRAIAIVLKQLTDDTEVRANSAFAAGTAAQERQRQAFVLVSVLGLALIALWFALLARSVSGRVSRLRDAASRVADARAADPVPEDGRDEIAELGAAFNLMRDQVAAREQALRSAQGELEIRVQERTRELHDANHALRHEVDERRRAEEQIHLLSEAVQQSPVTIMIADHDGCVQYVNDSFLGTTGFRRDDVYGRIPEFLGPEGGSKEEYRRAWQAMLTSRDWDRDMPARRRDGTHFWMHVRVSPVADAGGRVTHYLMVGQDISLRREQEEKILHQAHFDNLTDLPNRVLAMDRLSQAIRSAARKEARVALMFIDLDDFKKVNDTLGHDVGDELLIKAARRLEGAVRETDTVARHGGDEFLVIMSELQESADARSVADKIIGIFATPFSIGDNEVFVSPSIGVSLYPDDGQSPPVLLRNADLAMYDAKEAGRNMYRFFNRDMRAFSEERLALEWHLRNALERDELRLVYQPLIDTTTRALVGAEALLRWESPIYGMVPPDQFIPVAERAGTIVEIGNWVLRTACAQVSAWRAGAHASFRMAVNVSPRQFWGQSLVETVRTALEQYALPAACLEIEITEGVLIRNPPEVRQILDALTALGVRLVMDDFGTGYSSLSYLKRFPFHTLKIDREFIRDLATDSDDRALVTAAIRMGKGLALTVLAEGVETEEQLAFLAEQGCDLAQGYLFSPPVSAAQFAARWLAPPLRLASP